jgi:hypothetical protein
MVESYETSHIPEPGCKLAQIVRGQHLGSPGDFCVINSN